MTTLPAPLAPLAAYRQWIIYRLQPHPTKPGKHDKIPCSYRTGGDVSLMNPVNWTDYETAAAAHARADIGHGSGVGFVFTPGDPFWFLDVDGALSPAGEWSPLAAELYHTLPDAAWEVSQSGRGLHAIGSGPLPPHGTRNQLLGLELYHKDRFVALTLRCVDGGSAGTVCPAAADVAHAYFPPIADATPDDWTSEPVSDWAGPEDDATLLRMALASRSAASALGTPDGHVTASFSDLWEANVDVLSKAYPGDPYGASEADAALASHLAFWTGKNCERIERLMRQSALVRDKWDRASAYLEPTILRACAVTSRVLQQTPEPPAPPPIEAPGPGGAGRTLVLTAEMARDKANHLTVEYWLAAIGVTASYDEFSDLILLSDRPITDHLEREIWFSVRELSGLKFAKDLFGDVLRNLAWRNRVHPLREWLAGTEPTWDGRPRIDNWLTAYLGVADSPYSRAIGALFLTAGVRRIRQPGAKYDEMLVLEGPQGVEKSTAMLMLCEQETWFSDDIHLGMDSKQILEVTFGKWIVEAPELSRMNDSEIEHIKAMLSRRYDRARLAFERATTERGRQFVFFGTTNADAYLRDPTGNRRIWPVKVGTIDLAGIARDRSQLWAEAAQREASGASIRLPRDLWAAAADEQEQRVVIDPIYEKLRDMLDGKTGRIRGGHLLEALHVPLERQFSLTRKMGEAMKKLGWENKMVTINTHRDRFYVKGDPAREIIITAGQLIYKEPSLTAA